MLQLPAPIWLRLGRGPMKRARVGVLPLLLQLHVVRPTLIVAELLLQLPVLTSLVRGEQPHPACIAHQNPELVRHSSSSSIGGMRSGDAPGKLPGGAVARVGCRGS